MQKLVYFRFMRFSGRFRPSFTPFGANYGFPFLWTPFFSFEVEIFFKNAIFQKCFFFEWIFSTTFFSLRIFLGCRFDPKIGPLSIHEVFRAIPALLHPRLEQISDFNFFMNSFFSFEVQIFFQKWHFQKNIFFGWIFSTIFVSLRIFWGCRFDAQIGPLSTYEVFRAIPALLHPVSSRFRISFFLMNSIFFLSKLRFPRNGIFH